MSSGVVDHMSTQELLDAQAHIFNHMFSHANPMSLKCAIELGIPDAIHKHGKPITLSELANALPSINKAKSYGLYHLMRLLAHSNFFERVQISDEEAYCLTNASCLLIRDDPKNVALMALFESDPIIAAPWLHMSEWFQNEDVSCFVTKHGRTMWEHVEVDQRFNDLFYLAMESDSRLVNSVLVKECRQVFEGLKSVVDVGGGTGETAKGLVEAFPGLRCIVLDLPRVVSGLEGSLNLTFVSGHVP